jgi:ferredoxin
MILYFSATGNSHDVANRLAEALDTQAISILDVKQGPLADIHGFVCPTYAWGLPSVMEDFLATRPVSRHECGMFFVATYGTTPGQIHYFADKALRKGSGFTFDAFFGVKMPDTWTPIFDLSSEQKVQAKLENVQPQIEYIINKLRQSARGNYMKGRLPAVARLAHHPYYDHMRKTSNFHVEQTCVSCGLCARDCPVQAICMMDKRPVWKVERCAMCLGCLHRCPKFAIQYGGGTKAHGQYVNPNTELRSSCSKAAAPSR